MICGFDVVQNRVDLLVIESFLGKIPSGVLNAVWLIQLKTNIHEEVEKLGVRFLFPSSHSCFVLLF